MQVSRDSWHFRTYKWVAERNPTTVNLCPYMRAVFIWAPLKFIVATRPVAFFFWGAVAATLPLLAARAHHWKAFFGVLAVYAVVAAICGGTELHLRTVDRRREAMRSLMSDEEWHEWRYHGRLPVRLQTSVKPQGLVQRALRRLVHGIDGTIELLGAFIVAIHDKVCPILYISQPLNAASAAAEDRYEDEE